MFKIVISVFLSFVVLYASSRVANYSSTLRVNKIIHTNEKLHVLTGGGLFTNDFKTDNVKLECGSSHFPDPDLTASAFDKNGNLWIASNYGYLARLTDKWEDLSNTYQTAGWKILSLYPYQNYLFVGSSKGISIFNLLKKRADKNAVSFNTFTTTKVNAITVFQDNLYIGLDNGLVRLDSISKYLNDYNFFDPSIWKVDESYSGYVHTFIIFEGSLHIFDTPTALYNGKFLSAKGKQLIYDGNIVLELPSDITCLTVSGNLCWIGTTNDCYYKWDGINLLHFTIPGPKFTSANAVAVDKNHHLWVIPTGSLHDKQSSGFHQFDGKMWSIHNNNSAPGMGLMPSNPESQGITVSRDGAVWISTASAHMKRYIPSTNNWSQFCTYSRGGSSNGRFYHASECPEQFWAKTDAVAQDSSGYIWIGCWENPDGSLICYDPRFEPEPEKNGTPDSHYKRFFDDKNQYYAKNIVNITVDAYGNIIIGNTGPENIMILQHDGNPIQNGVKIKTFTDKGTIIDAASTASGKTYVITTNDGVCEFKFDPDKKTIEFKKPKTLEKIGSGITAVEVENEDILWFASPKDGLIRYNIQNDEKMIINQVNGLISLNINDLAIDRENGFIWASTDVGVSRISIGVRGSASGLKNVSVFPVPFQKGKHTSINFHNVPSESKVAIFSIQGQLIANASVVISNAYSSYYSWDVPQSVIPGTYYYSITGKEAGKSGKLLIVP